MEANDFICEADKRVAVGFGGGTIRVEVAVSKDDVLLAVVAVCGGGGLGEDTVEVADWVEVGLLWHWEYLNVMIEIRMMIR